ncbi:MAG: aminoacyl-tRNA hydrolase [Patescibacteria group bacterium]|nr:aminoacyl-tRNA hydrolase [Patescibacteria group bacterium]
MPQQKPIIKLIIGLGNPGKEYENTYHNIGMIFLDYLLKQFINQKLNFKSIKNFSFIKTTDGLVISKPEIFMNESGRAIKEILKYFNIKPENTVIVHDDSDIKLGNYKIEFDRGPAGHKGIESIINSIGSRLFWRIRIGVREKSEIKRQKAEEFILKKIKKGELEKLIDVFEEINRNLNEMS